MLYFYLDLLSVHQTEMDMSNKYLGIWAFQHGGNVKSRRIDLKVLQIEVIIEVQGQVTSPVWVM